MSLLHKATKVTFISMCLVLSTGCKTAATKKVIITGAMPMFEDVNDAIYAEEDLDLIRAALPAMAALTAGFVRASPKNRDALTNASAAFLAMGLLTEDDDPERAARFYKRATEYGNRALLRHRGFRKAMDNGKTFEEAIEQIDSEKYLPALLWTGFSQGLRCLILGPSDPSVAIEISKVTAIIRQVMAVDTDYFHGVSHVMIGILYASTFMGTPEDIKKEFKYVFDLTKKRFLLAQVYYARYYAISTVDEKLFDSLLKEVDETPLDIDPSIALLNALAKDKAKKLASDRDCYFP